MQTTVYLPEIIQNLQPVRAVRFVAGIFLLLAIFMLTPVPQAFSQDEEMEEIPVTVRVQGVGADRKSVV